MKSLIGVGAAMVPVNDGNKPESVEHRRAGVTALPVIIPSME